MTTGVQFGDQVTRTVKIDTNLADKEGFFVTLDTSSEEVVNIAAAASAPVFILEEGLDGSSTEGIGSITLSGRTKLKIADTIAPGDKLTSDGNGNGLKTTTDTDHYGAIALEVGVTGDLIEVLVVHGMVAG